MDYIRRIRDLREDSDYTQEYVAHVLGTSQTMYARYERGANELPIRHLSSTMCLVIIFWDYQTKNKNGKYELIICHSYFNHPIGLVTRIDIKQAIYEALLNINSLNHIPHHLSSEVPKKVS